MDNHSYLDNRELSWLKFNQRVLEEAQDPTVPLFERLRFVAIFCSNLDEFFMIRVGSLYDQTLLKKEKVENKTNMTAAEQLEKISEKVKKLLPLKDAAYADIMKELAAKGITEVDIDHLSKYDEEFLRDYFKREILPLLAPSIIDKNHPVQFLKNKEIYIATILKPIEEENRQPLVGVLTTNFSEAFDRLIFLPSVEGELRFVLVEKLILRYADLVFTNYQVKQRYLFRITRNADINANEALFDHDLDFRDVMEELCKKRKKLAPIRIEFQGDIDESLLERIDRALMLGFGTDYVFTQTAPLDMGFMSFIEDKINHKSELFFDPLTPQQSPMIDENEPIIKQAEKHDILLTYPYESFQPFIRLLREAADDPTVKSIKITLYRVARDSKIVNALITAAENGKDVLALVELRARFDEENNIGWSKRLEEAGVRVMYGLEQLKVHSKLLLITKKNGSNIQYITQVGTGNYNERTSKLYTDMTLITSAMDFGADASLVFNSLSEGVPVESTDCLWVAPRCLKSRVVELIDNEILYGKFGYIGIKMNSLTDRDIIEKLAEASCRGVKIELIIRGICCIIAGVPDRTEKITVTSIVGRLLEHSRIYIFGTGERERVYISSADFMTRNTERRVEVAAPIRDPRIKERIVGIFNTMLRDNVKARVQQNDGSYIRKPSVGEEQKLDSQRYFFQLAYANAAKAKKEDETAQNKLLARIKKLFSKQKG